MQGQVKRESRGDRTASFLMLMLMLSERCLLQFKAHIIAGAQYLAIIYYIHFPKQLQADYTVMYSQGQLAPKWGKVEMHEIWPWTQKH